MQIRQSIGYANPNVIEDAFALRQRVFTDEQGFPAEIDVDEYDNDALHIVIYLDNQPVAVLRALLLENGVIKVGRVAVLKQHRGKKLGQALMQYVAKYGHENHYTQIRLSAQHTAIDFYKSLGYQTEGEMYDEDGMDHISMSLTFK